VRVVLKRQVVKGVSWALMKQILCRGLNFLKIIILTKLLLPDDFGAFGIAAIFILAADTFTRLYLSNSLIQKKDIQGNHLNTGWALGVTRAFFLIIAINIISPYVSSFYGIKELSLFINILSLTIIFRAITNAGVVYFERDIRFRHFFAWQSSGDITEFIITVWCAYKYRSPWALIIGKLAGSIVRCSVSYMISDFRSRFIFDPAAAKELFRFSRWIMVSSILAFFIMNGDDLFIGKALGASSLGFYRIAFAISIMPITEIANVISRVGFPAYSRLQGNLEGARVLFLNVTKGSAFFTIPISGLFIIYIGSFTEVFLDKIWMPVAPCVRIIALLSVTGTLGANTDALFKGLGMPKMVAAFRSIQLVIFLILIYPFTIRWGIVGTAMSCVISSVVSNSVECLVAFKRIKIEFRGVMKDLCLPVLGTLFMAMPWFCGKACCGCIENIHSFFIMVAGSICIYLLAGMIFDKYFGYGIYPLLKDIFYQVRGKYE